MSSYLLWNHQLCISGSYMDIKAPLSGRQLTSGSTSKRLSHLKCLSFLILLPAFQLPRWTFSAVKQHLKIEEGQMNTDLWSKDQHPTSASPLFVAHSTSAALFPFPDLSLFPAKKIFLKWRNLPAELVVARAPFYVRCHHEHSVNNSVGFKTSREGVLPWALHIVQGKSMWSLTQPPTSMSTNIEFPLLEFYWTLEFQLEKE